MGCPQIDPCASVSYECRKNTHSFVKANEVNLMENENNEMTNGKIDEFKTCLAESGVQSDVQKCTHRI